MLRINFDIQRVHVEGASLYYVIYYKQGNEYVKVNDKQYQTRADAKKDIDDLIE